jgi:hypothetical protein
MSQIQSKYAPKSVSKRLILGISILSLSIFAIVFGISTSTISETHAGFKAAPSGLVARAERQKARDSYFKMIYADPATGDIPAGITARELRYAKTLPKIDEYASKGQALALSWAEAGPNDVSGRTRAIAIDVTNSNTVLVGGANGGIWRSTTGGSAWTLVSPSHLAVTRIVQDPRNGQTSTWYAATGESSSTFSTGTDYRENVHGTGIYKSTDNGVTWTQIQVTDTPTTATGLYDYISEMVISPTTGSIFALLNQNGVYRSTDGGTTFNRVLGEDNNMINGDIAVDPNGNLLTVMYNTTTFVGSGVFKSADDGTTWTEVFENNGNAFPVPYDNYFERTVIGGSKSNPDVAYLLTNMGQKVQVTGGEIEDVRLFKLVISTGTYTDLSDNMPRYLKNGALNVGTFDTQQNYNMTIAVHPTDENHVLIGGTNLFRTRDGFQTVAAAADGWIGGYAIADDISSYANNHPDHHALVFDPNNPNKLYNGNDGGVDVVNDITTVGPVAWTSLNNSYNVTQFFQASIARTAGDNRIAGGTQDNGSPFFTFDGTTTSASVDQSTGDGAVQYLGTNILYSSAQNGGVNYYELNNGTLQYMEAAKPCDGCGQLFVHPYTVDPVGEQTVFYPAGQDLYRGVRPDQVNTFQHTWTKLDNLQLPTGYGFSALSMSTSPAGVLYYAGYSANGAPLVFRLADATNATTGAVNRSIPGAASGAYILSIAINPSNADEIMVSIANYNTESLYHSTDGGQTYAAVEGNLAGTGNDGPSVRSTSILPFNNEVIYIAATSSGIYSTQTLNGSSTVWAQQAASTIGNTPSSWIDSRPSDGRIVAATHGRGIFLGTPSTASSNSAPVATNVNGSGNEDATASVTLSATDANSDPLTYSVVTQPTNGTVTVSGTTATYTPSANFNGSDSFTYKANDGTVDSNTATASVTVAAVNDAPTFTVGADQTLNMNSGAQTVATWATDISAGPANEASQTVTFVATSSDANLFSAGPAVATNGTLTFTSAENMSGTATITVVAKDDGGTANGGVDQSDSKTFTINIVNNTSTEDGSLPTEFALHGAYPNPFNPSTTISFDLPVAADVEIQVVDLIGRTVMTVPRQSMTAGRNQRVQLNASSLTSGSYMYRVIVNGANLNEVKVGTFVLLK